MKKPDAMGVSAYKNGAQESSDTDGCIVQANWQIKLTLE